MWPWDKKDHSMLINPYGRCLCTSSQNCCFRRWHDSIVRQTRWTNGRLDFPWGDNTRYFSELAGLKILFWTDYTIEKTVQYRSKKIGALMALLRNYLAMSIFLKMVIFHYFQKNVNLYATKSHQQINGHAKMFSMMSSPS